MITNDFIKGYIQALDTLDSNIDYLITQAESYCGDTTEGYENIKICIKQQKENYKKLVKELNETQSKKDTP